MKNASALKEMRLTTELTTGKERGAVIAHTAVGGRDDGREGEREEAVDDR